MENIDLITYFNYGFLAVIALSVLLGFWFGAFRSIYFFAGFLTIRHRLVFKSHPSPRVIYL